MKSQMPRVFILAGGQGTRLKSVISDIPKPMAPIAGKPFLDYLLDYLQLQGASNVTFLLSYKKEVIMERYKTQYKDLALSYVEEATPLGTGGALLEALNVYADEDEFLVMNGDTFFGIDLPSFCSKARGAATLALTHQTDVSRYGSVELAADGKILMFREKKEIPGGGFVNGGIVKLHRKLFEGQRPGFFSFEKDVLEKNLSLGLYGLACEGSFIDIGIPSSFQDAQTLIPKWID